MDGAVEIIDQTALPEQTRILRLSTVEDLVDAIRRLAVRGAPARGVAGALGVGRAGGVGGGTEPALEAGRLTAWGLGGAGVPLRLSVGSAGRCVMASGEVGALMLGAGRICANGDVVNKVGTYAHALGARRAGIPFLVVAPESTVDTGTPDGAAVQIEDRGRDEVLRFRGTRTAPDGVDAVNPAFDVTPYDLVTAIVTDRRVIRLDQGDRV